MALKSLDMQKIWKVRRVAICGNSSHLDSHRDRVWQFYYIVELHGNTRSTDRYASKLPINGGVSFRCFHRLAIYIPLWNDLNVWRSISICCGKWLKFKCFAIKYCKFKTDENGNYRAIKLPRNHVQWAWQSVKRERLDRHKPQETTSLADEVWFLVLFHYYLGKLCHPPVQNHNLTGWPPLISSVNK